MAPQSFKFVDLFAGIGGFHKALELEGGNCVLAVEKDEDCRKLYGELFPGTNVLEDIRGITFIDKDAKVERHLKGAADGNGNESVDSIVPDHDVLCAGFPCQPFSKSGKQKGTRDKTRGTLFHDVMTIVQAKNPEFVMLENVRNLTGPRHRDTWKTVIESLREAGYGVSAEPLILSPHKISPDKGGTPQVRERVFILAYRCAEPDALMPIPIVETGFDPKKWKIEKYLDDCIDLERYGLSSKEKNWFKAWQFFIQNIDCEVIPGFPLWVDAFNEEVDLPEGTPGWKKAFLEKNSEFYIQHRKFIDSWKKKEWGESGRVEDFPASRRKFEWQAGYFQPTKSDRDLYKLVLQLRPSGLRVKPPTYLPALVAMTQTSIIGEFERRITPIEASKLQGFTPLSPKGKTGIKPKWYSSALKRSTISDASAYKQLGNAVNVGVARLALQALFEAKENAG